MISTSDNLKQAQEAVNKCDGHIIIALNKHDSEHTGAVISVHLEGREMRDAAIAAIARTLADMTK